MFIYIVSPAYSKDFSKTHVIGNDFGHRNNNPIWIDFLIKRFSA